MLQLVVVVAVLVVLLHLFVSYRYDYWKKKGVSGPSPTFLLGNLGPSLMMKQNPGQIYQKIYEQFTDKPYVGYYKFLTPGIILRDIQLIKDILIKDFNSFHDNDFHVDVKVDPMFGRNPFVITGQHWKEVRNLVTSGITASKIKNMFYLISNVCKNIVSYLEQQPQTVEGIEAKELANKFTTDAVASCAFGLEAKCLQNDGPESEFLKMGKKVIAPTFWLSIKHMIMIILPTISRLLKLKFVAKEAEDWFYNVVKDSVEYRDANNINRQDYLDMLRGLRDKSGGKFGMWDVTAQAFTFFADGFETSAISMSHILYELGENPEIQTKLRNEIDTVLARHNGEINYDSIQEMNYLDCVFHEGLRRHSPAQFIIRLCTKRFELPAQNGNGTVTIEPGTPVVVPVLGIHFDPTYYPNPQKFDPDRFNEENRNSRPKCTFLGFGEGPRYCLGSKFGLAQTKAALAAIISNFEVSVNPKTIRPLQLDPKYFLTNAVGGIWLNFEKRR